MTEIPLTQGKVALVDDADMPMLSTYRWVAVKSTKGHAWYAIAHVPGSGDATSPVKMHRLILPGVPRIDHRDLNGLNNQRHNLRPATQSQNLANLPPRGGTSRFKGVAWHKAARKWVAYISVRCQRIHLGLFVNEAEAAEAYNVAALELYGEFARPNTIEETT